MSTRSFALPLFVLLACGDPKADTDTAGPGGEPTDGKTTPGMFDSSSSSDGTASSGGPGTSGDPSQGTSEDPPGVSTSTSGVMSTTIPDPADLGPVECDPFADDCPEGQKCTGYGDGGDNGWHQLKCVPIDPQPDQAGDPCTVVGAVNSGVDSCDEGLICFWVDQNLQGTCVPWCSGSFEEPTCEDPDAFCNVSGDSVLSLCLGTCDPLLQDCQPGDACYQHPSRDVFTCVPDLSLDEGELFDPCEYINVCDPGLACLPAELTAECDPMTYGCCVPFCDLIQPNTCPGEGQECLPALADPPPKYENVGVCALPG
ncbi:ribulose phosphate epimerase [Nannocystis sp. ILAH1]|uniref:ribulose phosphate epimerase n=1 Tax=unclassified Nannocystis TaxID=2627009 RepID=UPI00226DDF43|nr:MULTISPECIES: ribulose phosphate epimerase [unclassified Nannocystis]MCY0985539.1 ribulose phosphate epimerase [Nannocystis sp. ILAH1]MCY1068225.1 ribulose phosphate epimerase [Nannocystis sp. RBIL2]